MQNRLKPTNKKGVSTKMHYKGISPENFVLLLLHMEMGMGNQAWDQFEEWFNVVVEVVPCTKKRLKRNLQIQN
jgi:hypothetical protein